MKKLPLLALVSLLVLLPNRSMANQNLTYSLNYSGNLAYLVKPVLFETLPKFGHTAEFRAKLNINKFIHPTTGIGFLNTGNKVIANLNGLEGYEEIQSVANFNYIYIPLGVQMDFKGFYCITEIGLAFNISNRLKVKSTFVSGKTTVERMEIENPTPLSINKVTVPILLTVGKTVNFQNKEIHTGVKVNQSLSPLVKDARNQFYFGAGIFLGITL